jgi:hypothetical protein
MNFEILNVNESPLFDTTIAYAEKRTHPPYASSSFNNNDEIRIPIQQQDIYTLPWYSSLHVQGKVEVRNETNVLIESPDVRFVNMGILFLFNEIRLEVAGDVVDRVRNPGIMSVMKGYVTYNTGQSKALENGGWFPKAKSTLIDKTTGLFDAIIPLRTILGLCEDFKKIVLNSRHELVLVHSNTDNNAFIFDDVDATARSAKVLMHKIAWRVPHISVAIKEQLKLLDVVKSARELYIPFRSRELHEYPMLSQTQRHTWAIKSSIEKPQYIVFGLQTERKDQIRKDCSRFDHCNLSNIKVFLNDTVYPYDNLNINYANNQYALLYDMFTEFQTSFLYKDTEPIFTREEFKELAPIVVIDCSKQKEELKRSPIDIRIEFETNVVIPNKTTAYCLILHDRIAKYVPIKNIVSLVQ